MKKKERLDKRLEKNPVEREAVVFDGLDLERGLVRVRINPNRSREMIHHLIDKVLESRWPPLHKERAKLTPELRAIADRGFRDMFEKMKPMFNVSSREFDDIINDFRLAWDRGERFRTESRRNLEVYRLKKVTRRTFKSIGKTLGMKEDAARKAYHKASEMFPPGDPLRKDCGTCSDKTCLKTANPFLSRKDNYLDNKLASEIPLCPEMQAYSRQEWGEETKRYGLYNDDITPDPRWEEDV